MSVNLIGVIIIIFIYFVVCMLKAYYDCKIKGDIFLSWYLIVIGLWDVSCCCFIDYNLLIGISGMVFIFIGALILTAESGGK